MVFGLFGCGDKEEATSQTSIQTEAKEETTTKNKSENKIDKFIKALKDKGFTVGEKLDCWYQMIGANDGCKFEVNGERIEIYYYDPENLSEEGKKYFEQAKNGTIDMGGIKIKTLYSKDNVLINYEKHEKQSEIIEIFNNL